MNSFSTKHNIDDIVFHKATFTNMLPYRVSEIHFQYYGNNQDVMVLDVHYTLTNKQHDLRESYVTENSMFVTEAQAVARYMDAN